MGVSLSATEYDSNFDTLRQNRIAVSQHKYGSAKVNFGQRLVNARGCIQKCLQKYEETHNTEYLVDAANYCMFEYMYPQFDDAFFRATSSEESAGIDGITIKEIEEYRAMEP